MPEYIGVVQLFIGGPKARVGRADASTDSRPVASEQFHTNRCESITLSSYFGCFLPYWPAQVDA